MNRDSGSYLAGLANGGPLAGTFHAGRVIDAALGPMAGLRRRVVHRLTPDGWDAGRWTEVEDVQLRSKLYRAFENSLCYKDDPKNPEPFRPDTRSPTWPTRCGPWPSNPRR